MGIDLPAVNQGYTCEKPVPRYGYLMGKGTGTTKNTHGLPMKCTIDVLRPTTHRTSVEGPMRAAVTDFASPILLAAGTMDPSDAHVEPA
jgi:hypothetical protein